MKVVVLGAGGVGAYYGGQLARTGHDVTLLARGANLAAVRERGLELRTPGGNHRVPLGATDRVDDLPPADFAILAVKSYSLSEVAPAIRHCATQGATIVPLLNGVETTRHLEALDVPRASLVGGLTSISVVRTEPGVVELFGSMQIVVIGELDGRITKRVTRIAQAFQEAGVEARASDRIDVDLWQKFIFLAALAAACGLARAPVGPLRAHPLGARLVRRAAEEVLAVGLARGIGLRDDEVNRVMTRFETLPADVKPSFLLDLEAGGRTELDVLSGAVARFGEAAGVPTPIHDTATAALGWTA